MLFLFIVLELCNNNLEDNSCFVMYRLDDDNDLTACDKRGADGQFRRGGCSQSEGRRAWVPPDPRATLGTSLTYKNKFVERVGHDTAGNDRGSSQLSDTLMSLGERQKNSTDHLHLLSQRQSSPPP